MRRRSMLRILEGTAPVSVRTVASGVAQRRSALTLLFQGEEES
jgi:hypothetical protein